MLLMNIFSWTLPDCHCLLILQSRSQDSAVYSGGKAYHECPYLIAQILGLTALPLLGVSCLERMKNAWCGFLSNFCVFYSLALSSLPFLFRYQGIWKQKSLSSVRKVQDHSYAIMQLIHSQISTKLMYKWSVINRKINMLKINILK